MKTNHADGDIKHQQALLDMAIRENMNRIKHKLIVMSGKGGVGKSTIATNLTYGLSLKGFKVGIMDSDIHGPSLGKMLGIEGRLIQPDEKGLKLAPIEINGIKIVSMASLLPDADAPVIWRGPMKMTAIKQFLGDIEWSDLDFLIIDSPPGTGDEPLSVCQLIPESDGSIIVTTPQDVALIDSRKTVRFSQALKIPILGIVENMSGFNCPHCGKSIDLFKTGGGEKAAQTLNVPFLGKIPIDPEIVVSSDNGRAFINDYSNSDAGKAMQNIVDKIIVKLNNPL
jgi:ATP-binding protein involved in chromosome partitioning